MGPAVQDLCENKSIIVARLQLYAVQSAERSIVQCWQAENVAELAASQACQPHVPSDGSPVGPSALCGAMTTSPPLLPNS